MTSQPMMPGQGVPGPPAPPPGPPAPAQPAPPPSADEQTRQYYCASCGAPLRYAPGSTVLRCESCGAERQIAAVGQLAPKDPYDQWASQAVAVDTIPPSQLRCRGCGAPTASAALAQPCPFCGSGMVAEDNPAGLVGPKALVPFVIDKKASGDAFNDWVGSRWFAPSALKKVSSTEGLAGWYLPHWDFDAHTDTRYVGERGVHYWVTEGSGQNAHQVMRTAWTPVSGHLARAFDDVLAPAAVNAGIPPKRLEHAGPWEIASAVPYQPDFLAGYTAPRYDVNPDGGLQEAETKMRSAIEADCRASIGGDEQRLLRVDINYSAVLFRLILLPLWLASYLYAGKTYHVFVNANTGHVVGDRPYSRMKITLAVIGALVVIAAIVAAVVLTRRH